MRRRRKHNPIPSEGISRTEANIKIHHAAGRIGLMFTDVSSIIEYDPTIETACWSYNPSTGKESVRIGRIVEVLEENALAVLIRHEVLHRSLYNGFHESFSNHAIANIALDICINRILFETFRGDMYELSSVAYPPESKETIIALADCSANPDKLSGDLSALWHMIWDKLPGGSYSALNPASLYARLLSFTDMESVIVAFYGEGKEKFPGRLPDAVRSVIDKTIRHSNKFRASGSGLGKQLDRYSVTPVSIGASSVEKFISGIRVRKLLNKTAKKITETMGSVPRIDPYPLFPTRKGLVWQALGISREFMMYHNKTVAGHGAKMELAFYVDVSGSMQIYFPVVTHLIGLLRGYPLRFFVFDTEVREASIEEFSSGIIEGGGGTDFNKPVENLLEERDFKCAILFTDGYGELHANLGSRLRPSGKHLFTVIINDRASVPGSSGLTDWSDDYITLPTAIRQEL